MENIQTLLKVWHNEADLKEQELIKQKEIKDNSEVEVLLGDFTFLEHPVLETIVNRIDKRCLCKVKDLDTFCEDALEDYEGYLIPSEYKGQINY